MGGRYGGDVQPCGQPLYWRPIGLRARPRGLWGEGGEEYVCSFMGLVLGDMVHSRWILAIICFSVDNTNKEVYSTWVMLDVLECQCA